MFSNISKFVFFGGFFFWGGGWGVVVAYDIKKWFPAYQILYTYELHVRKKKTLTFCILL